MRQRVCLAVVQRCVWGTVCIAVLALGLGLLATGTANAAGGAPATWVAGQAVTFENQIAPLLRERCGSCHRPGAVAPFSVLTRGRQAKGSGLGDLESQVHPVSRV